MTSAIPNTNELYEMLVRLHAELRQTEYPYSAKVLKWGIIKDAEIEEALAQDPDASEETVWSGLKPTDVASRLAGGITAYVDQEGYRNKWMDAGLSEGSWKTFIELNCMLKPDPAPFNNEAYLRNSEMENVLTLVKILDKEVFGHAAMKGATELSVSLKSKWWKECHKVFNEAATEAVYRGMKLPERPKSGICHTAEWTSGVKKEIGEIAARWRKHPLWDRPQNANPDAGVDWTNNNEATIKVFLSKNNFTSSSLEGR
jgi:hypothetical protein